MENENEDLNSQNQDSDQEEENLETAGEVEEDNEDDTEAVVALKEKNRQLFARAKKAEDLVKKSKTSETKPQKSAVPQEADLDKLLDAKLEKRELESLDLSENLKKEVASYAKMQGISIKKALSSDYISFIKEKEETKQRIDDASLGSKQRGNTKKDYSKIKLSDIDMRTPEGKADFAKYEERLRQELG